MTTEQNGKPVGLTRDAGFEVGVRKTFNISPRSAWDFLFSEAGLLIWMGELASLNTETGSTYQTDDGTRGKVRAVKPGSHIRVDWQPADWPNPVILQVRVIPTGNRATISFHLEKLSDAAQREEMHIYWTRVMNRLVDATTTPCL